MDRRSVILERAEQLSEFPSQAPPEATEAVIKTAEAAAAGTLLFYRHVPVEVGLKDIDWTGRHIAHQEWPAQLNRFVYLRALAAAWRTTRDEKFAAAAKSTIEDWIGQHPDFCGLTEPDNRLNVSIRLGSGVHGGWGAALAAFLDSPLFDDAFLDKVFASMEAQAAWLSANLTTRGNWRVSQLDCLVFTALRFPFLSNAEELLRVGIRGMRTALATQFLPDGVHVERTPSYHWWMAQVLVNYFRLGKIFPETDLGMTREQLVGPLDYAAQSTLSGFNDATAPVEDPESSPQLELRREVLGGDPPLEQTFSHGGQVFARSSFEPGADYLAFDASSWGGWHSHLSRLSFAFRSRGRELLADTGNLSYEVTEPIGPYGKSTAAHSTLNLNGWHQGEVDAKILRTEFTPEYALINATYQGGYYEHMTWKYVTGHGRGTFGSHERVLLWVKGEYLLSLDRMDCDDAETVHSVWQSAPVDAWEVDAETLSWHSKGDGQNLLIKLIDAPKGSEVSVFEGETDPPRGLIGNAENQRDPLPAPLVEFRYPGGRFPGRFAATLIVPFEGDDVPEFTGVEARFAKDELRKQLRYLTFRLPDGTTDTVCWSAELELPVEIDGPFTTDATFVWCRRDSSGSVLKRFLLDGTFFEVNGDRPGHP